MNVFLITFWYSVFDSCFNISFYDFQQIVKTQDQTVAILPISVQILLSALPVQEHATYVPVVKHDHAFYRSGTVNSKSFVCKILLRIKWKFELTVHFKHEMLEK